MLTRSRNNSWGRAVSLLGALPGVSGATDIRKLPKGYRVESSSGVLVLGAAAARRARWIPLRGGRLRRSCTRALPVENIAAKKLLESWLTNNVQEQAESWALLERALEENRSSDRTLFS